MNRILQGILRRMQKAYVELKFRIALMRSPRKIIVGAWTVRQVGWVATDIKRLNLLVSETWAKYFRPASIDALLAEHVWEHLSLEEGAEAAHRCFAYLKEGGYLRIAVPDGLQPLAGYIEAVKPGGSGVGAGDHRVLYDYKSLANMLESAGFVVRLLEYFDEKGQFHANPWNDADGRINRSSRNDARNVDGELKYTSLIVDAVKPRTPKA